MPVGANAAAAVERLPLPADDALVVFTPSGRRGHFPRGTPILKIARSLGVDIDSVCGGRGICGRCQVSLSEGSFAKHGIESRAENLSSINDVEIRYDSKRGIKEGRRLSCQALLQGDVVIDVPADSQVHKQVVRKRAEVRDIEMDPAIRLHYVEVEEPDMHKPSGDLERLLEAPEAAVGPGRPGRVRSAHPAMAAVGAAPGAVEGHRRGPSRQAHHGDLAGLP